MQNPRLANRYAKSLLDLTIERNSLEDTLKDMQLLHGICSQSRDFVAMLKSPVISGDKKQSVVFEVLKSNNVGELTKKFISLLITKGRELNLPEIAEAFIAQYNLLKSIRTVTLTTAAPMTDAVKSSITAKIAGFMPGDKIELKTAVDESLIGGFVLETEDKLYDASIKKSLDDVKTKLLDYTYVAKM
ncbi:MAG: atpH [Flavipsychrobacter sp.]|nr:atpH [Flavipsychrobacter sp.]